MRKYSHTHIGRFLGLDLKRNVRNSHVQTEWKMGWSRRGHDAQLQWKRTSRIPWIQCFGTRSFEKARKIVNTLLWDKTVEAVLRTIISVTQLSIYGAVADMCDEMACRISGCSESTRELVAQNSSETTMVPTELSTTNKTPRTSDNVQGKLLQNYEQKIENLPYHLTLINCAPM